jgi:hypothetical protein
LEARPGRGHRSVQSLTWVGGRGRSMFLPGWGASRPSWRGRAVVGSESMTWTRRAPTSARRAWGACARIAPERLMLGSRWLRGAGCRPSSAASLSPGSGLSASLGVSVPTAASSNGLSSSGISTPQPAVLLVAIAATTDEDQLAAPSTVELAAIVGEIISDLCTHTQSFRSTTGFRYGATVQRRTAVQQ